MYLKMERQREELCLNRDTTLRNFLKEPLHVHSCSWLHLLQNSWQLSGRTLSEESRLPLLIFSQFAHWFGVIGTICLQKPVRNQMLIDFVLLNQPLKSPASFSCFWSCGLAPCDTVERKHTDSCLGIGRPNLIMPPTQNGASPGISRGA